MSKAANEAEREVAEEGHAGVIGAPFVLVRAGCHVLALLRHPLHMREDLRPDVLRHGGVIHQRRRRDRDAFRLRGLHRHAAVVLAEVLDQAEVLRAGDGLGRQGLLVEDEEVGVLCLADDGLRPLNRHQPIGVGVDEAGEPAPGLHGVVEPFHLEVDIREEVFQRDDVRPRVRVLGEEPGVDLLAPVVPVLHPQHGVADVVPDHDLDVFAVLTHQRAILSPKANIAAS
jgi:hypothetical protein